MPKDHPFYQSESSESSSEEDEFCGPSIDLFQNPKQKALEAEEATREEKERIEEVPVAAVALSKTKVPLTHEIVFPEASAHLKGITAMALDKHTGT